MAEAHIPGALRIWWVVRMVDIPALFVGAVAAAAGDRWGAYVLVVNLVVQISGHLAVGGWAYHGVMARPWPQVAPLDDDAWDD